MPKATADDVIALGFRAEQFGKRDDFAMTEGLVWQVLLLAEQRIRAITGDALYDAATPEATGTPARHRRLLISAESYLAGAELWRRREAYADAELAVGRSVEGSATIGSRYLENAARFEALADDLLAEVCGRRINAGGGIAAGFVETGPFTVSA